MPFVRFFIRALAVAGVIALAILPVHAQSAASSGQIVGQVLDASDAAVADAAITARQTGTNLTRATRTDFVGRFALSLLPLGPYEIVAAGKGFELSTQEATVTLGGSATANFVLGVGGVRENVQVTAEAGSVRTNETSAAQSVLTAVQLENIPASGRRVRMLFQLTPGTQIEPECGGFSISGQKGTMINFNVDGGDCTNVHYTGFLEFTPTVGLEALEEMQVLRGSFSAEFGRSTGGIINVSTRSGTNQLHGSGYYLFRNDATTKTDALGRIPIGTGQQYGASLGGPLKADRTFFFTAPEFQYNTKPVQTLYAALDTQNLRNTAAAQQLLQIAPEGQYDAISDSRSIISRVDHRLNDRHGLMARVDYTRNHVVNSIGSFILAQGLGASSITERDLNGQQFLNDRNTRTGMVQFQSVLSNRMLNEVRAQIFHEFRPGNTAESGPEVSVRNLGASIAIYGPQATGLSYGNTGYRFSDTRYQIVDNLSFVTGAHTAKLGVDANLLDATSTFDAGSNGVYTFNSLADFIARRPFQYSQFAGSGTANTRLNQIAMYVQDEWRVRPGLTISPGFRYEMALANDYLPATVPQNRFPMATHIPGDRELVGPRIGLAWDPEGSGRTVVRAAGGVFYSGMYTPIYDQALMTNGGNPELSSQIVITNSGTGNAVADAFARLGINLPNASLQNLPVLTSAQLNALLAPEARIGQTVNFIDPDFKLPRAVHARIALERQLASGILATVDVTNINTTRIARVRNLNLAPPVKDATGRPVYTSARPYGPKFGFVQVTESSARATYQAFTAALNIKRPRYMIDSFYTLGYSRSEDDAERPVGSIVLNDAYNMDNEYNWSNIDQRHQFATTALAFLPKAFELSSTMRFSSARPFSAMAGSDLNRDGVNRDRAVIDGVEVRRNTYRNTPFREVNLRVQRGFALQGGSRAILSIEIFNVFNSPNVELGSAGQAYGPGTVVQNGVPVAQAPNATFGRLKDANGRFLSTGVMRTSPLQAQLGFRVEF